jgi:hypothetical protein
MAIALAASINHARRSTSENQRGGRPPLYWEDYRVKGFANNPTIYLWNNRAIH